MDEPGEITHHRPDNKSEDKTTTNLCDARLTTRFLRAQPKSYAFMKSLAGPTQNNAVKHINLQYFILHILYQSPPLAHNGIIQQRVTLKRLNCTYII